jgi:VIT1/CCC1 family predicted Fe2+/Mn2+ transporter
MIDTSDPSQARRAHESLAGNGRVGALTDDVVDRGSSRVLDPIERISEVLFGLFMVLTFTGTLSVVESGRDEVRSMLVAAIGCNIAWGFVDGVMYVLRNLVARGRKARLVRAVHGADRPEQAHRIIGDELGGMAGALGPIELERVRQWIVAQPVPEVTLSSVTALDLRAAVAVFLLVFLSTFPVVLPFVFITDPGLAKRVSAAVAIAMLFLCGYGWGRYASVKPWRTGVAMVLLGLGIEAVVIALGG